MIVNSILKQMKGEIIMNKRVYGVIGISSIMANWNADFTGYPKNTTDGTVFGSDKALKYPMKKMWSNQGEKVLYIKSMKFNQVSGEKDMALVPRSLKERYEQIFDVEDLKKEKDAVKVLKNLFSAVDVKNFGATFAEEGTNISITGAVQFGQGFNKYEESAACEQQILSPFRDAKDEEAKNSTLGTKIVSDEAHYFYPFNINPITYKEFVELGVTEGYTEEDYEKFKKVALKSATSFSTNAKEGCENEFTLFVETDEETYLPNLSEYMEFTKGKPNTIILNIGSILNAAINNIQKVEIYYNTLTTKLEEREKIEGAKYYDILTGKEV